MREQWFQLLRKQIKAQHGKGWGIEEQSERVKMVLRIDEGLKEKNPKTTTQLDIPWKSSESNTILNAVTEIRRLIESRKISLKEAAKLYQASNQKKAEGAKKSWESIAQAFLQTKEGFASSSEINLQRRLKRTLGALGTKPFPRDGRALMQRYANLYFSDMPSGGDGRRRDLMVVKKLLEFAVNKKGMSERWLPLSQDEIKELIGISKRSSESALTPPVQPEDLIWLLDCMEKDGKHELRLAVGLVGLYGIRPSELATLIVKDGELFATSTKRNSNTVGKIEKPRLLHALEIKGNEGLGAHFLSQFDLGQKTEEGIKLPLAIRNQIKQVADKNRYQDVGSMFKQLLERYSPWKSLVKRKPGIVPYSLRHGWAWRAHKCSARPLSVRDAAAFLGHSPQVHMKNYGRWIDEQGLRDAGKAFNAALVYP